MATNRTYKIRRFTNGQSRDGQKFTNFSLTIPAAIAEKLPVDMLFECELTEDGILFRPVQEPATTVELPSWAQPGDEGEEPANGTSKNRQRQAA
jgi:hypothetical protein